MADDQTVSIDGHRLALTNLDKVLYPATGTTKAEVLDYYARIAELLIPHVRMRPVTRKRWVHGVGTDEAPGSMFFQKNLDARSTPQWVSRRQLEHSDHTTTYPLVDDRATLVWLAQTAALELHVPQWRFGRTGARKNPDRLVLDLDPGPGAGLRECAEVARRARAILTDMGLQPLPVTSGSKGIHLYAALDGRQSSDEVSAVARELARALEADDPALVVSDMKKTLRDGRVLVDWSQNNGSKTTIAPYSLRGRTRPTVAAPRTWDELDDPHLRHLDFTEVLERAERIGDPVAALDAGHLAALEPTSQRMAGFEHADGADDRLARYRSMREASATPEPVPAGVAPTSAGRTFVIQEHHASRLHWDFRLEHDGVLVSWALPKGVPTDPARNHLAVQTEDHPLEYGTFEGSIPAGQYGAGQVSIWDAGSYDLEKWREGHEVIATLHGRRGSHRYALIRTGGRDGNTDQWLIHLMAPEGQRPPRARRVLGGRARRAAPAPMLATPGTAGELGGDAWAFEMKWDGVRVIAEVAHGAVRAFSRNGIDVTATYPELQRLAGAVDGDAVLDGEVVAMNRSGRPDFGLLQRRMKLTRAAEVERTAAEVPVRYLLFDVLSLGDDDLAARSYAVRRQRLTDAVRPDGVIEIPPAFDGDVDAALATSRRLGLEGVIAKRLDSRYSPGRRSRAWVKLKHRRAQAVVVGGWRPGSGARAHRVGSLLLGIPDADGGLRYVGRVGSGLGDRALDELAGRLRRLERVTSPFADVPAADARDAHWVTPRHVAEVAFSEWTPGGRLRHPVWRGWRPDVDPAEVVVER